MRRVWLLPVALGLACCLGASKPPKKPTVPHLDLPFDTRTIILPEDFDDSLWVCIQLEGKRGTPCKLLGDLRREFQRPQLTEPQP